MFKADPIRRQEIKDAASAVGLALLVHLAALALLILGTINWRPFTPPMPQVTFTLVDAGPIIQARREQEQAEQEAEQRRQAELERQREAERQAELERRQAEQAERERQQELERQQVREAERERQRELERQRQEQERERIERERRAAEEARQRELEDLRRQRDEAQHRREEEERRLAELAERRAQEEAEQRAREEAERLRLAREQAEVAARQATLREEYIVTIAELVRRNWIRPPTTNPGVRCTVRVVQIPGGEIIDAAIVNPCNADDATRRSIIAAVNRTGELPYRGYENVFERQIEFVFIYDG